MDSGFVSLQQWCNEILQTSIKVENKNLGIHAFVVQIHPTDLKYTEKIVKMINIVRW